MNSACVTLIAAVFMFGCALERPRTTSTDNSVGNTPSNSRAVNVQTPIPREAVKVNCADPDGFGLTITKNIAQNGSGEVTSQDVNIVAGEEIVKSINFPMDNASNLEIASAERTPAGFSIAADWGGKYHYDLRYDFRCRDGKFFLHRFDVETFIWGDQQSMDKPQKRSVIVNPELPIENFSVLAFLGNNPTGPVSGKISQ